MCASRSEEDVLTAANASCDNRVLAVWTNDPPRQPDDHLKKAGQASNLSYEARHWLALAHVAQNASIALRNDVDFDPVNELNKDCYVQLKLWVENNNSTLPLIKLDETGYTFLVRARLIASIQLTPLSHFFLCAPQINYLVMRKPSALKGVVTESGPGPGAPNFGAPEVPIRGQRGANAAQPRRPYNPLQQMQFKHPKIKTELAACFERDRIDGATSGAKSWQLKTSADRWSVTLEQFFAFCEHCFADPMYTVIKNASDEKDDSYDGERKMNLVRSMEFEGSSNPRPRGSSNLPGSSEFIPEFEPGRRVTGYDLERYFVKPWTAGCRHGVALMMNANPIECEVMFSHAWGEDMEQLYTMLRLHERSMHARGEEFAQKFNLQTRIWFCIFGLYQGAAPLWLRSYILRPLSDCQIP